MSRTGDELKLQRDVTEELEWDPAIDAAHIGVSARDGVVAGRLSARPPRTRKLRQSSSEKRPTNCVVRGAHSCGLGRG